MVFDFRLARACDFDGIQEIFAHYVSNTVMTLVHNVPSTLGRIQHTTEFPRDEDDETPAYPVYLPVPVLVAHHITDDGKKPQIVGYTFLGPARNRDARNSASMELYLFVHPDYVRQGIGGTLLSMLLTMVHSDRGIRCFEWVIAGEEEVLFFTVKPYKTTRITVSVSVDPDSEDGGEWLPEWFKTKGFVEYKRLKGYSVKFNRVCVVTIPYSVTLLCPSYKQWMLIPVSIFQDRHCLSRIHCARDRKRRVRSRARVRARFQC